MNSLLQPLGNNLWPTHSTNKNYRTQLLRQSNYLLGFVSPNKYSLDITINKKWLENPNDLEEDKYESPPFVYRKETNAIVPLVRSCFQTPPRMQGSWSEDDVKMTKAMVESSRGIDGKSGLNVEGSHNTTTNEAIDINDISKPSKHIRKL